MLSNFRELARKVGGVDLRSLLGPKGHLLGVDIGSSSIKLVQMKETKGRYRLEKFGMKPLEPEVIVDGRRAGRRSAPIR